MKTFDAYLRLRICFIVGAICLSFTPILAQSPVSSYFITNKTAATTVNSNSTGWNASGSYDQGTVYHNYYGQNSVGASGVEREITGFNVGDRSFSRLAGTKPFDKLKINRHPLLPGDTINMFYEYTNSNGNNLYLAPSYISAIEDVINSYVCNRGSDNLFSNAPTTRSNIERLDMIKTAGIYCIDAKAQGFLVNERGGNDNFKVAVITALDGAGNVASLGNLVTVTTASWGKVGPDVLTRVMSRRLAADAVLRAKEDVGLQTISGVYISFEDLSVPAGATIYGLCLFPNDVTNAMDLLGLTNVPTNTNQSTDGGLDMVAGLGYFFEDFILASQGWDLQAVQNENQVQLSWQQVQAMNVDHFLVEKSTDGVHFSNLGLVQGSNGNQILTYSYSDKLNEQNLSVVYYRLKIQTSEGKTIYSNPITVRLKWSSTVKLYPNPFQQEIIVTIVSDRVETGLVSITSITGAVIRKQSVSIKKGVNTIQLTGFDQFLPGQYCLKLNTETKQELFRIIKQ